MVDFHLHNVVKSTRFDYLVGLGLKYQILTYTQHYCALGDMAGLFCSDSATEVFSGLSNGLGNKLN